ncbi:hypothetical protein [Kribbella sp. NPDC048915]|uniref:hypothetical protein n=1 Tax=Kribbella sp. NPDC048915 TaxID=3155148 RepID=UPI0034041F3C
MYMSDDNKRIGWWLKEVDRRLEESFEQALAAEGLTRRQWQALNAAARGEQIAVSLAPFLRGDAEELAAVTGPLVERGWLLGEVLTADGERALRELSATVRALRQRVTAGISGDEYLTTVGVLRRMAANLG